MPGHPTEPDHTDAAPNGAAFGAPATAVREEVLRIVSSTAFKGSRRTQQLLEYIVENGLSGHADRLKERTIGVEIFGRPATYVTGEDSIVRVTANDLRKRLNHYYREAGAQSSVKIELPPGSYVPVFSPASPATASAPEAPAPEVAATPVAAESQAAGFLRNRWLISAFAVSWVALFCTCLVMWSRVGSGGVSIASGAGVPPPWPFSRVFSPSEGTAVIVADASYGCLRMRSGRLPSLDDYLNPRYPTNLFLTDPKEADARLQRELAGATLTSFADVSMVVTILRVAGEQQDKVQVRSARDFGVRDNENGNSILVGGPTSNPWATSYNARLNFYADVDRFRNRNPRPGERAEYQTHAQTGEPGEDYALIALVPASNRKRAVLLVQGIRQEGTEAASLFLREPEHLKKMRDSLGLSEQTASQGYFEVLLHTRMMGGAPGATDIVATRAWK